MSDNLPETKALLSIVGAIALADEGAEPDLSSARELLDVPGMSHARLTLLGDAAAKLSRLAYTMRDEPQPAAHTGDTVKGAHDEH